MSVSVCMCVYAYLCVHVFVCVCVCASPCVYTCGRVRTGTCVLLSLPINPSVALGSI